MTTIKAEDYEILGQFYLGKRLGKDDSISANQIYLYDSRDLLTHAVCIGMTGSGKTGLCLGLLEEAAMDGIPVIAVDPKGDLGNLLLTFPNLSEEEFAPWVNEEEARRNNLAIDAFAGQQASLWRDGLAKWGQDADRIKALRQKADFAIYTPGGSAGRPLSIVSSFKAPTREILEDRELVSDQVNAVVTSLLNLIGVTSDPLTGREHILLSKVILESWMKGSDLNLFDLVNLIQSPPLTKIGAFDLESFYPCKDRFELAMLLNNLLASPGFETWLDGDPLDIDSLLYTKEGKPRVTVLSINHLDDSERMFFVSLLLNQLLGWMRRQSGSSSLRSIFYMDEIFGYFPPVANPPSKKPLLTLLKQARAFGLGLVLASQNPGDLDYKGLSNTGTWFIGRLQTERDKEKVLEGLVGTAGGESMSKAEMDDMISRLGNRVFLVNNVHEKTPALIETRWTMSYLRGPFSRAQIKKLSAQDGQTDAIESTKVDTCKPAQTNALTSSSSPETTKKPSLPQQVQEYFIPATDPGPHRYRAMILATGSMRFTRIKPEVDTQRVFRFLFPLIDSGIVLNAYEKLGYNLQDLFKEAESADWDYASLPDIAKDAALYEKISGQIIDWLVREKTITVYKNKPLKETSSGTESKRDFQIRLQQVARERRDQLLDKLREKYSASTERVEKKIETANRTLAREKNQADHASLNSALNIGASLIGAFVGRRKTIIGTIRKASSAARSASGAAQQADDVDRARNRIEELESELVTLDDQFKLDKADLEKEVLSWFNSELVELAIKGKKSDVEIDVLTLAWYPESTIR